MTLNDSFQTALTGLQANKSRSALTILGIVIGVAAIIMVMSVGQGAENLILGQIQGLGSRTIIIEPGREQTGPSAFTSILSDSLKERDVEALRKKSNVPDLVDLTPVVLVPGSVQYLGETTGATTIGASDIVADILEIYPAEGFFFSQDDINAQASVAVIGSKIKDELFGLSEAIGEKIRIKNRNFRIVGVLPAKGQVTLFNVDEIVVIPYTTAQKYLLGQDHYNTIIARVSSEGAIPSAVRDIELTLRASHNIDDPDKDDFHVTTQADAAERVQMITGILSLLLVSVAAISLVVGGIGIMNIMLVSVSERTREIGLRKAIGATEKDIMTQFLLEAVMLTSLGGIVGIILGAAFSYLASLVLSRIVALGWTFTFPISAAAIGLGVAGIVGLVFGLYPAREASKKSPMEALRYE